MKRRHTIPDDEIMVRLDRVVERLENVEHSEKQVRRILSGLVLESRKGRQKGDKA